MAEDSGVEPDYSASETDAQPIRQSSILTKIWLSGLDFH